MSDEGPSDGIDVPVAAKLRRRARARAAEQLSDSVDRSEEVEELDITAVEELEELDASAVEDLDEAGGEPAPERYRLADWLQGLAQGSPSPEGGDEDAELRAAADRLAGAADPVGAGLAAGPEERRALVRAWQLDVENFEAFWAPVLALGGDAQAALPQGELLDLVQIGERLATALEEEGEAGAARAAQLRPPCSRLRTHIVERVETTGSHVRYQRVDRSTASRPLPRPKRVEEDERDGPGLAQVVLMILFLGASVAYGIQRFLDDQPPPPPTLGDYQATLPAVRSVSLEGSLLLVTIDDDWAGQHHGARLDQVLLFLDATGSTDFTRLRFQTSAGERLVEVDEEGELSWRDGLGPPAPPTPP